MSFLKRITPILLFITGKAVFSLINYADSITTDSHRVLLDSVITTYHIAQCCNNTTIKQCVETRPSCFIAPRLYDFTRWLILRGDDYGECIRQLDNRYNSLFGPDTFGIAPSFVPPSGDTSAPVVITAYIRATKSSSGLLTLWNMSMNKLNNTFFTTETAEYSERVILND